VVVSCVNYPQSRIAEHRRPPETIDGSITLTHVMCNPAHRVKSNDSTVRELPEMTTRFDDPVVEAIEALA